MIEIHLCVNDLAFNQRREKLHNKTNSQRSHSIDSSKILGPPPFYRVKLLCTNLIILIAALMDTHGASQVSILPKRIWHIAIISLVNTTTSELDFVNTSDSALL